MEPVVDPVPLVGGKRLLARQLRPERGVALDHFERGLFGVEAGGQADLGFDVEQFADDVRLGDLDVIEPLSFAELAVQLARLGVDEVGRQRAGVAAEERVGERAVAPEEPAQVQAREQLGQPVQEVGSEVGDAVTREEGAVGERVVEVPRDQHRVHLVGPFRDQAHRLDDRQALAVEPA